MHVFAVVHENGIRLLHTMIICRCGKTTLARLLAKHTDAIFKELSATDSGIADVRAVAEEARNVLKLTGRCVLCFCVRRIGLALMQTTTVVQCYF